VKKINRISAIVLVALLYCYAVGFVYSNPGNSHLINASGTEKGTYFSVVSVNLFCHTPQSENTLHSFIKIPAKTIAIPFNKFSIIKKSTDRLFFQTFTQYSSFAQDFLILYRKFNLIFPFHNFW